MSYLKASDILPPLQNIINQINDSKEIVRTLKRELEKIEDNVRHIFQNECAEKIINFEDDDVAKTYLAKGLYDDVTIPR